MFNCKNNCSYVPCFPKLGQFGLTHFLKSNQVSDVVMMSICGTMKGDFACDPDESSEGSGG